MRVVVGASRNRNRFYGLCHLRVITNIYSQRTVKTSSSVFIPCISEPFDCPCVRPLFDLWCIFSLPWEQHNTPPSLDKSVILSRSYILLFWTSLARDLPLACHFVSVGS